MPDVRHEPAASRFVADVEGGEAELGYTERGGVMTFVHTFVPEPARGQDIGTALVEAGLDYAREHDRTIRPQCPFVAAYVEGHPEAQALVA